MNVFLGNIIRKTSFFVLNSITDLNPGFLCEVPQKQTLPVAPRTRTSQEELLAEVVQGQSRAPRISPPVKEEEAKGDATEKIQGKS